MTNLRGAERAIDARVDAMVLFVSGYEIKNLKNVSRTREVSLGGFEAVARLAEVSDVAVRDAIASATRLISVSNATVVPFSKRNDLSFPLLEASS